MTKFEYLVNGGSFASQTIEAVIIDLDKGETFSATINAKRIADIDAILPEGYELDKITTLQNYFNPSTVEQYDVEIENSQYIYFADFQNEVVYDGFYEYIEALENDLKKMERMNRMYQG